LEQVANVFNAAFGDLEFGLEGGCTGGSVDICIDIVSVFATLNCGVVEIESSISIAKVSQESISLKCAEDRISDFNLLT
jgi:hypothetical protein